MDRRTWNCPRSRDTPSSTAWPSVAVKWRSRNAGAFRIWCRTMAATPCAKWTSWPAFRATNITGTDPIPVSIIRLCRCIRKCTADAIAFPTASPCNIPRKSRTASSPGTTRSIRGAFCKSMNDGWAISVRFLLVDADWWFWFSHCSKDVVLTDQSLVHIFFTDLVSTRYRTDIYQNWLGTLATFGGILGLFLGFSLITGFELVYLFTARVLFEQFWTKKKKK